MPFRGKALIAIWNDIAADGRADFIEWHNREHIFERLSIPGFLSGYRYRTVSDLPEYFTLYEVESLRTTTGPDYQARLDNPTAWTKRALQSYRNLSRSLCEVAYSQGRGLGGYLQTIRFEAQAGKAPQLRQDLAERVLPPLLKMAGVTGLHLGIADRAASSVHSEEKKDHTVEIPSWVLLIEATIPMRRALVSGCSGVSCAAPVPAMQSRPTCTRSSLPAAARNSADTMLPSIECHEKGRSRRVTRVQRAGSVRRESGVSCRPKI